MIGLIDYNMGNLRSVSNAFEQLGVAVEIVRVFIITFRKHNYNYN